VKNRRTLVMLLALALLAGARSPHPAGAVGAAARPNVVVILADDLDVSLGGYASMSRVQRLLVRRGTELDRTFVPTALCCPSRASLLTGQYPHNHGVYTVAPPWGAYPRVLERNLESANLATALHDAGYRTALVGKYFNGYPMDDDPARVPTGWDDWAVTSLDAGYAQFDYEINDNGKLHAYGHTAGDYLGDQLAHRADDFLAEAAKGDQPFFLLYAPISPHRPATPAPRHAAYFKHARAPRGGSFDEADVSDKPRHVASLSRLSPQEVADLDELYRRRERSLVALDESVELLMTRLAKSGVLGNTYVFFSSDNGFHLGQHRLRPAKATAYEEDVLVPLVVVGPGVPARQRLHHLVSGIDLAPTIAELAGVRMPVAVDGRSIVPLLGKGPPAPDAFRDAVLLQLGPFGADLSPTGAARARARARFALRDWLATPNRLALEETAAPAVTYRALRTARYKYVEYASGDRELYDLLSDPHELRNLAGKVEAQSLGPWVQALERLATCAGEGCRDADRAALPAPRFSG
jgi:N-acetylglucosamine-6-sulfatase